VRTAAFAVTFVAPLAVFVWYLSGPLHSGWARRAGTPAALLRRPKPTFEPVRSIVRTSLPQEAFSGTLAGTVRERGQRADGLIKITIHARVKGKVRGALRIVLWGSPSVDGGVSLSASDVAFGATGTTQAYVGKVVSLSGNHVDAELANASESQLSLSVGLHLNPKAGTLTGQLTGQSS
jgi:hypothetical protein